MIKLVDYFVVVGYDDSDCVNSDDSLRSPSRSNHHNNNNNNSNSPTTGKAKGKIIQRFPIGPTLSTHNSEQLNNAEYHQQLEEFDANIHCFCQPDKGWRLYTKQEPPTFFVSVLTDIKGQHRYCACLTFLEPYSAKQKKKTVKKQYSRRQIKVANMPEWPKRWPYKRRRKHQRHCLHRILER